MKATAEKVKSKADEFQKSEAVQNMKQKAAPVWEKTVEVTQPYIAKAKEVAVPVWEKTKEAAAPVWAKTTEMTTKAAENMKPAAEKVSYYLLGV